MQIKSQTFLNQVVPMVLTVVVCTFFNKVICILKKFRSGEQACCAGAEICCSKIISGREQESALMRLCLLQLLCGDLLRWCI